MNKTLKRLVSVVSAVTAVGALCGVAIGCAQGTAQKKETVVSYVSTDSTVYNTTADLVAAVADSVVEIKTEQIQTQWGYQYVVSGAGSGVIVGVTSDFDGYYIITNHHVVSGAEDITVTLRSGVEYDAELVASDERGDIAVLSIQENCTLNVANWGDSDDLRVGEDLIAIGNPLGSLGGTVTKGILSATGRSIAVNNYTMMLLQTDTAINPGNSGGGLFNAKGELIGVVNAKTSDEEIEGICFAIPANDARDIYTELVEQGYVTGRATFDIEVTQGTMNNGNIIYVSGVGGVAENTFAKYDYIVSINDKPITTLLSYHNAIDGLQPGETATIKVRRGSLSQSFMGNNISFSNEITTFTAVCKQLK